MPLDIQASIDSGANNPAVLLYLSGITLQLALDALNTYIEPTSWYPAPNDEDEAQNYIDTAAKELMSASMITAGMLMPYATSGATAPPSGWLVCNGTEVSKTTYASLFAVIGTKYGTAVNPANFVLPNLITKTIIGTDGSTGGSAFAVGHSAGSQTVTLSVDQIPSHTHKYDRGLTSVTLGPSPIVTASGIYTQGTTYSTGSGASVPIMQPYIALYWLIKT